MPSKSNYTELTEYCNQNSVVLVAVSKTKPQTDIAEMYSWGQRVFGENRVAELVKKYHNLPKDIEWHMVGHLQRNKVKDIAPFVSMIHSGDSIRLLREVNKEAMKNERTIDILLQLKIAEEESKYGWQMDELIEFVKNAEFSRLTNIRVRGVMGMATFTDNVEQVRAEFSNLKSYFDTLAPIFDNSQFDIISMGMTGDYRLAVEEGATMIRVGSLLFGVRD